ncbi:MAG: hypothetical protein AAGE94_21010 [Acidobacteriota bacterium]
MSIYTPNKTCAKLLVDYATERWGESASGEARPRRLLMMFDLYIKARSYAILNKVAFFASILAGIMVLVWPSLAIVSIDFGMEIEFLKSAIVQTTVTGLAALTFAIYSHYKKRQMYMENLMRVVVFSDESDHELSERVLKEMERIDSGFSFSGSLSAHDDGD